MEWGITADRYRFGVLVFFIDILRQRTARVGPVRCGARLYLALYAENVTVFPPLSIC